MDIIKFRFVFGENIGIEEVEKFKKVLRVKILGRDFEVLVY